MAPILKKFDDQLRAKIIEKGFTQSSTDLFHYIHTYLFSVFLFIIL